MELSGPSGVFDPPRGSIDPLGNFIFFTLENKHNFGPWMEKGHFGVIHMEHGKLRCRWA